MKEQKVFVSYIDEDVLAAQQINKKFAVVAISIFLSLIILPSLVWGAFTLFSPDIIDDLDFDTGENRAKAEMPEEVDLSTITAKLESYYNDRVPFRSILYTFQNDLFLALEKPYTDHIQPFLTDLFYSDWEGDTSHLEEESHLDINDLFGEETEETETLPDVEIGDSGDKNCDHTLKDSVLSHASCSEFGQVRKKCTKCGYTELHYTEKISHREVLISTTQPTCTSTGKQVFRCSICQQEIVKTLAKTAHNGSLVKTVAASYEDYGYSLYHCKTCDIDYRTNITAKKIDTSYFAPQIKGSVNRGVIIGRYDWLFYTGNDSLAYYQGTNVLSNAEMKEYVDVLNELQSLCDQKGIQLAFMCMPNREIVYAEYMPTYTVSTPRRLEVFTEYLEKNSDLNYVYPLEEIKAYKPYFQTHYKHDTHWNSVGAFIGTQTLYRELGLPSVNILDLKVTYTMRRTGDIFGIGGLNPSDYPNDYAYTIHYKTDVTYKTESSLSNGNLTITTSSNATNKKNLVLFGDSFRGAMCEFLSKDFSRCTVVHRDMLCSNAGVPVTSYNSTMVSEVKKADILVITSVERYDYNIVNQAKELIKILKSS
ncbi:MAG: hypothetical protein IJY47_00510 [Clostridia bacterium]|nr:hypothetical protein [Clostridia bacterium]